MDCEPEPRWKAFFSSTSRLTRTANARAAVAAIRLLKLLQRPKHRFDRRRQRIPFAKSLIRDNLGKLPGHCLFRLDPIPDTARTRKARDDYYEMRSRYVKATKRALHVRTVIDCCIAIIELTLPFFLAAALKFLGATWSFAVPFAAVLAVILASAHLSPNKYRRALTVKFPPLATISILGCAVLTTEVFARLPGQLVGVRNAFETIVFLTTCTTAVASAAIVILFLLHRHRRGLVGYFLPLSHREEIIFELMQIVLLLRQARDLKHENSCRKSLIMEKLSRIRYLFTTHDVFSKFPVGIRGWTHEWKVYRSFRAVIKDYENEIDSSWPRGTGNLELEFRELIIDVMSESSERTITKAAGLKTVSSRRWSLAATTPLRTACATTLMILSLLLLRYPHVVELIPPVALGAFFAGLIPITLRILDPKMVDRLRIREHLIRARGRTAKGDSTRDETTSR